MSRILVLASTLTLVSILAATGAYACLAVGRPNPKYPHGAPVRIAEESAVIFWDAENKTEHFIRRARFETTSPDLGFLVPTPTKPTLVDVGDSVFEALRDITVPKRPPSLQLAHRGLV